MVVLGSAAVLSALQATSGFQAETLNCGVRFQQTTRRPQRALSTRRTPMRSSADASTSAAAAAQSGETVPIDSNAFRLVQYRENVELQTAVYKVVPRSASVDDAAPKEIVLVSMVHLADQGYYTEIMRDASSYDRVLFELIAGADVSGEDADGNRAVTDYVYPTREQVKDRTGAVVYQYNCRIKNRDAPLHRSVTAGRRCTGIPPVSMWSISWLSI